MQDDAKQPCQESRYSDVPLCALTNTGCFTLAGVAVGGTGVERYIIISREMIISPHGDSGKDNKLMLGSLCHLMTISSAAHCLGRLQ